jgi:hypothetical protein
MMPRKVTTLSSFLLPISINLKERVVHNNVISERESTPGDYNIVKTKSPTGFRRCSCTQGFGCLAIENKDCKKFIRISGMMYIVSVSYDRKATAYWNDYTRASRLRISGLVFRFFLLTPHHFSVSKQTENRHSTFISSFIGSRSRSDVWAQG